MNLGEANSQNGPLQFIAKHHQNLKWIVYALLVLNFGYYLFDDWRAAQSTLLPGASFLEITGSFATTFDELGWFVLLFLLEIETYWIEDDSERGLLFWLIQAVRVLCYIVVFHTLYAFVVYVIELGNATILTDLGGLCAVVGEDLSFTRNLLYELVSVDNCASLSEESEFYRFYGEPVVSDASGYQMAVWHAWVLLRASWQSVGWPSRCAVLPAQSLRMNPAFF